MSKAATHSRELGRARSSTPMIDKYAIVPISACVYVLIASPLLVFVTAAPSAGLSAIARLQSIMTPRPENKIFWPVLAAISIVLVVRNWSRLTWPPHVICLFAYLGLAGVSVLWAFKPELSFSRFVLQVGIVTSIVLPAM